ncbi:PHP domain-containing protein [Trebonia kvetii]|uniref:PHP domain-containing protein n=1 Tax=Trebonia kvetii TaxID=2480626 RepID=A0A6P2C6X4_9ACTN|nr:CehA/McbA family metallohydrolase [Trebonia kvetii]TVZ06245.1 PHP domain-containing protein [Trebonia kvetii]
MGSLIRHTGRFTLDDRIAAPWHYLPVEVPAGTAALRVTLSYPAESGAVLDLGCFDPAGFRGWSGGARESFVVSEAGATPGYLPGPVPAGVWQVIIGVHLLPADGVPYALTAEALSAAALPAGVSGGFGGAAPPVPADRPARRALPSPAGMTWLAGDLHAHTEHSDGVLSVAELASFAVTQGLDFAAVTDHNTVSHHASLGPAASRYGVTLLPGQEVTTVSGHAGVIGDAGWIDFREPAASWLTAAEAAGALMSVNHPFAGPVSWLHPMPRRPPLLEVWHWSWLDPLWTLPLSWWQAWDPAAIPVGGSDWHRPGSDAPLGTPTTWVLCADPAVAGVLDGLRAGRVAISASRDGPLLLRQEDDLLAVAADGLVLTGPSGPYRRISGDLVRLPGAVGYQRLLTPAGVTLALTP